MYSAQLRIHGALRDPQRRSFILQERLNGLSAAINALQLVHPAYAWIDAPLEETCSNMYPSKKARITVEEQCKLYFKIYLIFSTSFSFLNVTTFFCLVMSHPFSPFPAPGNGAQSQRQRSYLDVEKLENEFILTSAEYLLSLANVKWTFASKFDAKLTCLSLVSKF